MNIDELFSGIGMVVDDHVFSEGNSDNSSLKISQA